MRKSVALAHVFSGHRHHPLELEKNLPVLLVFLIEKVSIVVLFSDHCVHFLCNKCLL